jgi:hypothetical protein
MRWWFRYRMNKERDTVAEIKRALVPRLKLTMFLSGGTNWRILLPIPRVARDVNYRLAAELRPKGGGTDRK